MMHLLELIDGFLSDPRTRAQPKPSTRRAYRKDRSERVVLGPTATPKSLRGPRAQLRERKGEPAHTPLFCSNRGTRLSYDALHYQWAQACAGSGLADDAGKPRYTLHQLRHTRATKLLEQGQRLESVQHVLGRRDPRSTQGYAALEAP